MLELHDYSGAMSTRNQVSNSFSLNVIASILELYHLPNVTFDRWIFTVTRFTLARSALVQLRRFGFRDRIETRNLLWKQNHAKEKGKYSCLNLSEILDILRIFCYDLFLAWKILEEREAEEEAVELFLAVMIWVPTSQNLLSISDSQSIFHERNRQKVL